MDRKSFKGNVWRELCARAVESNGGYSSRPCCYALEWTVGVYPGYFDWDRTLQATLAQYSYIQLDTITADRLDALKEKWEGDDHQRLMWDWIVEDMREGVTDADAYRTLRPEIAARYGLPGSEAKLHSGRRYDREHKYRAGAWDHTLMFDVEWAFAGRGGKHLCLVEFEGQRLDVSSDSLAETIREKDDAYGSHSTAFTNDWCQKLLAFIKECDLCFTSEAVDKEFEYQLAYRLYQDLLEAQTESEAERKEEAERQFWAERDVMTKD